MTDRFEDAVRDAARGLSDNGEQPTYHRAWQHGRRRRVQKRAALGVASALVLLAAVGLNLGNFGRSNESKEVDDVAVAVQAATPTVPATTAPVTLEPTEVASAALAPTPRPTRDAGRAPTPQTTVEAVPEPEATQAATQTSPTPRPTAIQTPAPTAAPTSVPSPTPEPTATPSSSLVAPAATPSPTPTVDPAPTSAAVTTEGTPGNDDRTDPPDDKEDPDVAATGPAPVPADARLVEPVTDVGTGRCSTDGDEEGNATCTLMPPYPCATDADARPGYKLTDSDNDGIADTCAAIGMTTCDTTGDALGDTPCIIEFDPVTETDPDQAP